MRSAEFGMRNWGGGILDFDGGAGGFGVVGDGGSDRCCFNIDKQVTRPPLPPLAKGGATVGSSVVDSGSICACKQKRAKSQTARTAVLHSSNAVRCVCLREAFFFG